MDDTVFAHEPQRDPDAWIARGYATTWDAQLADLLARQRANGGRVDRYALPFAQAREQLLKERRSTAGLQPPMHAIEEAELHVAGRRVGLRWYRAGPTAPQAVPLVYLHGGGWCVGSNDTHETVLRHLARACGAPVCGVDYSLAPEHPFPAALEDLRAVLDMLLASHQRVVLAGDSAGANLALVEAMRRRDEGRARDIAALLLFYGVYAPMTEGGSCAAYGGGEFGLSAAAQRRYLDAYLPEPTEDDPRVFPLLGELGGLPPAFVLAAELDLLFDDSAHLHHGLRGAGGDSALRVCRGMSHGFLNHANELAAAAQALREAADFARAWSSRRG